MGILQGISDSLYEEDKFILGRRSGRWYIDLRQKSIWLFSPDNGTSKILFTILRPVSSCDNKENDKKVFTILWFSRETKEMPSLQRIMMSNKITELYHASWQFQEKVFMSSRHLVVLSRYLEFKRAAMNVNQKSLLAIIYVEYIDEYISTLPHQRLL